MSHKGGHHKPKTQQIRLERRERAEKVAADSGYRDLSTEKKLERVLALVELGVLGKAAKQVARLQAQLKAEKEPKPEPKAKVKVVNTVVGKVAIKADEPSYNKKSNKQ